MTTKVSSTLLANTAVTAGVYGGTTQIPVVRFDDQGRAIYAANVAIFDTTNANNITSGTLASARLATSGVSAGSYGSPTQYPVISVDSFGRVTGVTNQTVTTITNQTTFGVYSTYQTFSGTGSQTAFTLNQAISGANTIDVFIGGAFQLPGSANSWTATTNTLTFSNAPPSGTNNITVRYTNQPGAVALIDSTNDSSNTTSGRAATPLAVKTVNDYATAVASSANAIFTKTVSVTSPVTISGGLSPTVAMPAATALANGYMTSTYASKLDGIAASATNVTNTNQLTNGAGYVTSSGSVSYASSAGSAGSISSDGGLQNMTVNNIGTMAMGGFVSFGANQSITWNGGIGGGNIQIVYYVIYQYNTETGYQYDSAATTLPGSWRYLGGIHPGIGLFVRYA
jgi:hypothetical protein